MPDSSVRSGYFQPLYPLMQMKAVMSFGRKLRNGAKFDLERKNGMHHDSNPHHL
jgi:hypothetical protein